MFCTSCGTKNFDDGNFCKQCGVRLDKPAHNKISEQDFERAMPEDERLTSLLERAYRARKDGDRLGAIALCREALDLRPNSTSCHSLLGQLYEQGGERDLAIEQYEQVLSLNPGSIADRVKLDELRGDVPSVVSAHRSQPHIVLADRRKDGIPLDYRVPSFVLAGVALMVLGGIFTMQMLTRQTAGQRASADRASGGAPGNALAGASANSGVNQQSTAGQSATASQSAQTYSEIPNVGGTPIIIQTPPAQSPGGYSQAGYQRGGPGVADNAMINRSAGTTNSAQDDDKDVGGSRVMLSSPDDNKVAISDPAPASTKPISIIKVNQPTSAGQEQTAGAADVPTGSNTHKNEAIADMLAQQGQYKQAGDAYLRALDGAGDDTAYIYRRAAWCFEKSGEKATAVSYYQKGIEAAQKLVSSGHQLEIAKNLIRECKTGINACSN